MRMLSWARQSTETKIHKPIVQARREDKEKNDEWKGEGRDLIKERWKVESLKLNPKSIRTELSCSNTRR